MSKVVFNRHTFNNGVLTVKFNIADWYLEQSRMRIKSVEFQELLNGEYEDIDPESCDNLTQQLSGDDGPYSEVEYLVQLSKNKNHLVRAIIKYDIPTDEDESYAESLPCCMMHDGENWIGEEYFVDMYAYELSILNSIRLGCEDNCKIPNTLLNALLKLFTVQAAVDAHSPQMEMIYGKIACGNNKQKNFTTFSRNCNCNG